MPKPMEKYSDYELINNSGIVSTLFKGYLKDKVSLEKTEEIMKKLSLPKTLDFGFPEQITHDYGNKYNGIVQKSFMNGLVSQEDGNMPGFGNWVQSGMDKKFKEPDMEPAFEEFEDGMREALEILEQNEKDIDFSDPNAKNHYMMLKGMLQKSYDGTLAAEMSDDPTYGISVGLTAKVAFEQAAHEYDTKTKTSGLKYSGTDTKKVLNEVSDTGILEGMTGGARLHEMFKDNIATGNTSRQELLSELDEQSKRYDKMMELTDEKVADLNKKNVLQNTRDEFTDGPRGIFFAVNDVQGKKELLNAGYPAEDVTVISPYYLEMISLQKDREKLQKELDDEIQKKPVVEGAEKTTREEKQTNLANLKAVTQEMEQTWKAVTDPENSPLTQEKRLENLGKLKDSAQNAKDVTGRALTSLNQFSERMDQRINAPLSLGDKALLSNNYEQAYDALKEADPRTLFTSSRQFRDLKQSAKELADMEKEINQDLQQNNPVSDGRLLALKNKKLEVMEKSQTYLRYKDRQMNGPDGHKHKRSELEKNRVQVVDGLYNKLLADIQKDNPDIKLEESQLPVIPKVNSNELLTTKPTEEARDFDSYLKQHTGKGAMNGTKEEMVDDVSKVLAAQIMPAQKPPKEFDPKVIDKAAAQIKDKFNLHTLDEAHLREALNDPKSVKVLAQQHHRETYGVQPDEYKTYLNNMRKLYRDMEEPDGSDKDYQKIYDNVKKIAHLPKDPEAEGLSMKKVGKLIEQTNSEIFESMDRYIDHHGKNIGPKDEKMLQVLSDMSEAVPSTEQRTGNMVKRIRDLKGIKDISHPEYIELETYGREGKLGLRPSGEKLQLSKNTMKELAEGLKPDLNDERQMMKNLKSKTLTDERAKEAPDTLKKVGKKLEGVQQPEKKSKEAGDNATKNAVKEKKAAPFKKIDDGVYL